MKHIILFNFFISSFMLGVIFVTQFVNYPLLLIFDKNNIQKFHRHYVNKISIIVAPGMIVELIAAILLIYNSVSLSIINLFFLFIIYLSTFCIQVPIHETIKLESNRLIINNLVSTNWIRTLAWFLKCVISFNIIIKELI